MKEITRLVDYIRIVCGRAEILDGEQSGSAGFLTEMDSMIRHYLSLTDFKADKESRADVNPDLFDQFLAENYGYVYSYQHLQIGTAGKSAPDGLTFFYRGVSDAAYPIVPGIYRSSERHEEKYYFNEIHVRCPEHFRYFDNLEKLTYMQHYGCPTRLLDITSNPLVALYFACLGGENRPGAVYIFGVEPEEVLYADSDRVQMLSKLAEFNEKDQAALRRLAYRYILKDKFPQASNSKYLSPVLERYYHAVKRNNSAFEREIVPFDMLRPQFVQPNQDNPRILKQDGAFIISGLDASDRESDMKIRKYVVNEIHIPAACKAQILQELEFVGINQASLFPEVDKVADYLRRRP